MNAIANALRTRNIRFQDETAFDLGIFVDFRDLPTDFNAPEFAKLNNAELEISDKGFSFKVA